MIDFFFKLVKKMILAALLIYSFDIFIISLGVNIPVNFFTIFLVSLFDFTALICLFVFSFVF